MIVEERMKKDDSLFGGLGSRMLHAVYSLS